MPCKLRLSKLPIMLKTCIERKTKYIALILLMLHISWLQNLPLGLLFPN